MQEMVTISIVTYNSRYIFNVLDQLKAELVLIVSMIFISMTIILKQRILKN